MPKEQKRKLKAVDLPRKRSKTVKSLKELPWKSVARKQTQSVEDPFDGMLELEEVDDVEVYYDEDDRSGRVARFRVKENVELDLDESGEESEDNAEPGVSENGREAENEIMDEPFDDDSLPAWKHFGLHKELLRSLSQRGYSSPTPIQSAAIPESMSGRDVVGVAQTGSGKTLAYGLPILHYLLSHPFDPSVARRSVRALILAPTRELALQVSSHLNECLNTVVSKAIKTDSKPKPPPIVSVATIVGGMSAQKQKRILDRGVDVLVATPGRLWDIIQEDDALSSDIKTQLKFLVLDEADRMIETGHFMELENILRLTVRAQSEDYIEGDNDPENEDTIKSRDDLQTFVFSATLSKDLQRNVKKKVRPVLTKRKFSKPASTLDELVLRLDFRDPAGEPIVIDISPEGGLVSTLKESRVDCLVTDKDVYLYYFLLRYPGRSIVFLSSIDGIRRLLPLMALLNLNIFPLHSQLQQKQRLKNLDRFKNSTNAVLLATDIAARGLDIVGVDHVIHFNVPRTADTYVHRNGRTARAETKGFGMLMCAPDERKVVRDLMKSLKRDESEIPDLPIDLTMLDKLKARVQLARQVELGEHKVKKNNHDRNWMKETADALGVDYDEEADYDRPQARKHSSMKASRLKEELKVLLKKPLMINGLSRSYITSGNNPIVEDLLRGNTNDVLLGVKRTQAGDDVQSRKKTKAKPTAPKVEEAEDDEWTGIPTVS